MPPSLSPNQLESLLPALEHVAELVTKSSAPSREDLQMLLLASGLKEGWAVDELECWATMLATVRGVTDGGKREDAHRALMQRGVPETDARLAVETVAGPAFASLPTHTTLPIQVNREVIGLGELKPEQGARTTLTVSGGPGRLKLGSDIVSVHPETFGPDETTLTVSVKGGVKGQVLWGTLTLESGAERVTVEVIARWRSPIPLETLMRQTLEWLRQEPGILDRFIEQRQGRWDDTAELAILDELQQVGFEPIDVSQVRPLLEERRKVWRELKIQALNVQARNAYNANQYEIAIQAWRKLLEIDGAHAGATSGIADAQRRLDAEAERQRQERERQERQQSARAEIAKLKKGGLLSYFRRKKARKIMERIADAMRNDNLTEAVAACEEFRGPSAAVLRAGLLQCSLAQRERRRVTREEVRAAMQVMGLLKGPEIEGYLQFLGALVGF